MMTRDYYVSLSFPPFVDRYHRHHDENVCMYVYTRETPISIIVRRHETNDMNAHQSNQSSVNDSLLSARERLWINSFRFHSFVRRWIHPPGQRDLFPHNNRTRSLHRHATSSSSLHTHEDDDDEPGGHPIPILTRSFIRSTASHLTYLLCVVVVDRFNADARPLCRVTARAEITFACVVGVVCDIIVVSK